MLLYLHGFKSSPLSLKAEQTRTYMQQHFPDEAWLAPQIPSEPSAAIAMVDSMCQQALAQGESLRIIGSSLGGYLATYLVDKYEGLAVLINPAVRPYELLLTLLGEHQNPYTQEEFVVDESFAAILKQIDVPVIRRPDQFMLLVQAGDEVLDYRQAVAKYHCCEMLLEAGGDHSFIGYEQHLDKISQFLQLR